MLSWTHRSIYQSGRYTAESFFPVGSAFLTFIGREKYIFLVQGSCTVHDTSRHSGVGKVGSCNRVCLAFEGVGSTGVAFLHSVYANTLRGGVIASATSV